MQIPRSPPTHPQFTELEFSVEKPGSALHNGYVPLEPHLFYLWWGIERELF